MKYVFRSFGYTIIEIIVVTAIMLVLVGLGVAGYSQFNQTQTLKQEAENLKSALRDAQNRALSGEKNISAAACGSGPNSLTLNHWRFSVTSANSYQIQGSCGGIIFGTKTYQTPSSISLSPTTGNIDFKPISQGVSGGSLQNITLTSLDTLETVTITITSDGDISVGPIN